MMLYLWQVSSGNIAAPGLSIFLSAGACLCRKAKFNKNLHLALWLLKLQWETQGRYLFFKACSLLRWASVVQSQTVFTQSGLSTG